MPLITTRGSGGIHYAQFYSVTSEYCTFWDSRFVSTAEVGCREKGQSVRFVAWNGESNVTVQGISCEVCLVRTSRRWRESSRIFFNRTTENELLLHEKSAGFRIVSSLQYLTQILYHGGLIILPNFCNTFLFLILHQTDLFRCGKEK